MSRAERFLKACRRQPVDVTPVWLMRQAGRYMPEYRAIRQKHDSILNMIHDPDIAAEVTLQPIKAFDIDAAIIFADILPLPAAMGLQLEFVSGEGPVFHNPVRSMPDVNRLTKIDPTESLSFTLKAIRTTSKQLDGLVPLIGFSGAPFTLGCYAIEGQGSRTFPTTRALMKSEPEIWHSLMAKLTEAVSDYLLAQAEAGAQALQLFDSWTRHLTAEEYVEFVQPYSVSVIQTAKKSGVPLIHFSTGGKELLSKIKVSGADVYSVDDSLQLSEAWKITGSDRGIQGNLDPKLLADGEIGTIKDSAQAILDDVRGRDGHIFNLGHGIIKHTPVEHVKELVRFVHGYEADT